MVFKVIAPMVRKHAQLSPLPANAQQPQDQLLPKISLLNHALTEPLELMPNAQPVSHKKLPAHAQNQKMVFKVIAPMERKHAQLSPLPANAQQPQDQLLPKISLLNHALTEPLELMPNAQPV